MGKSLPWAIDYQHNAVTRERTDPMTQDTKTPMSEGDRGAQVADDIIALVNASPRTPTTEEMMVAMAKALRRAGYRLCDAPSADMRQGVLDLAERAAKARDLRNRLEAECPGSYDARHIPACVALNLAELATTKLDRELRDEVLILSAEDLLGMVADLTKSAGPEPKSK